MRRPLFPPPRTPFRFRRETARTDLPGSRAFRPFSLQSPHQFRERLVTRTREQTHDLAHVREKIRGAQSPDFARPHFPG